MKSSADGRFQDIVDNVVCSMLAAERGNSLTPAMAAVLWEATASVPLAFERLGVACDLAYQFAGWLLAQDGDNPDKADSAAEWARRFLSLGDRLQFYRTRPTLDVLA